MAITATNSLDAQSSATASLNGTSTADSEQRFLKLLVTQLNNQDPLNPLANAELTSQLAQMSTVSGIEKLNTTLDSLVNQSGANQALQAASLIGRTVLVPGQDIKYASGSDTKFGVEMLGSADKVSVSVTNAKGDVVRTFDLGAQPMGVTNMVWDGKSDDGTQLADGDYTISVAGTSGVDKVAANTLTYENVASVVQSGGSVSLDVGKPAKVSLSDVKLIL